jgi:glycosyltransferase involved in cell wall biosynthesis
MESPSVAIIIPVRNRAAEMRRLLKSIAAQTIPADHIQTVVVDALSTDGTPELCRSFPFIKVLDLPAEP